MHSLRKRLTFSNVIALLALFVALGSGAYAVTKAPKNSVTSKSIRNGQIRTADLGKDAATGAKVKEATLGQVPSAATAGTASTADAAARATVGAQRFQALNLAPVDPVSPGRNEKQPRLLLTAGEVEVRVGCALRSGSPSATISLTSSTAANLSFEFQRDNNADAQTDLGGIVRDPVPAGGSLNQEVTTVGGNTAVLRATGLVRAERQSYVAVAHLQATPAPINTCSIYGTLTQAG